MLVSSYLITEYIGSFIHRISLLVLIINPLILTQIWVPTNPRGAERLPPGIVQAESDFYLRRLWGLPKEVQLPT